MKSIIAAILAAPFALAIIFAGTFYETWVIMTLWGWASPWGPLPFTLAQGVLLNWAISLTVRQMNPLREEYHRKGWDGMKYLLTFTFLSPTLALVLGWLVLRIWG